MSRFTDKLCPVCKTAFLESDDIVVCPDCGTPHHRDCYKALDHCGIREYHAKGFVWNGKLPDEKEPEPEIQKSEQPQQFSDPHCAEYPSGTPMHNSDHTDYGNDINKDMPEMDAMSEIPDPYQSAYRTIRSITEDETRGADGVSSKELCYFAGKSIIHYAQAFNAFRKGVMKNGKLTPVKLFMNFCAGLFSPIHQFYRRMDILGVGLLIAAMLTSIPNVLIYYNELSAIKMDNSTLSMLGSLSVICTVINFAITVVMCIFGDYIYYKFCVKRIKRIRTSFDDGKADGYYAALTENGTPSKLRAVIGILAYVLVMEFAVRLPALLI